jgi:hypothetical protein
MVPVAHGLAAAPPDGHGLSVLVVEDEHVLGEKPFTSAELLTRVGDLAAAANTAAPSPEHPAPAGTRPG